MLPRQIALMPCAHHPKRGPRLASSETLTPRRRTQNFTTATLAHRPRRGEGRDCNEGSPELPEMKPPIRQGEWDSHAHRSSGARCTQSGSLWSSPEARLKTNFMARSPNSKHGGRECIGPHRRIWRCSSRRNLCRSRCLCWPASLRRRENVRDPCSWDVP